MLCVRATDGSERVWKELLMKLLVVLDKGLARVVGRGWMVGESLLMGGGWRRELAWIINWLADRNYVTGLRCGTAAKASFANEC